MKGPVLTLASGNRHKCAEISDGLGLQLACLEDVEGAPDFVEDGDSFEANALIKARGLRDFIKGWALADDSGLAVDALDGAPGIHSARFAGTHGDDAANNALLLKKLEGRQDRNAHFVCVLALCGPAGEEWVVRGECHGHIATGLYGSEGFGYDPLFIPEGSEKSMAELGSGYKRLHSHRARALRLLGNHSEHPLSMFQSS